MLDSDLSTIQICSPFGFSFVNPWPPYGVGGFQWVGVNAAGCELLLPDYTQIQLGCFSLLIRVIIFLELR